VVQSEEYYPFGATFNSYAREDNLKQGYLYQTKKWDTSLSVNYYDFAWRQYDPYGVFTTTNDPHADSYPSLSPRSWAAGNPLSVVDPTGMDVTNTDFGTTYTGSDIAGALAALRISSGSSSQNSNSSQGESSQAGGGRRSPLSSKTSYHALKAQQRQREEQKNNQNTGNAHCPPGVDCDFVNNAATNGLGIDFDKAGKVDVVSNSILGIYTEGVSIAYGQVKNSRYWTAAAKRATETSLKYLRGAGYVGIAVGTFISGYELVQSNGRPSDYAKFGTGLFISGTSFIPYAGLPLSIGLGSYEAGGGFDGYYQSFDVPHPDNTFSTETMYGQATFLGH
jgi:RHS repeat-associated protein